MSNRVNDDDLIDISEYLRIRLTRFDTVSSHHFTMSNRVKLSGIPKISAYLWIRLTRFDTGNLGGQSGEDGGSAAEAAGPYSLRLED